ncbi:LysR family transcriptional regulator [Paraglaciecola aquimarina]|uniref:LysR family transcriptional regulator n=1 Tax=Paraglaciecola algarum TaxID=3050085 RepID=A0ABS9DAH9_9ALTE|nr:LysR family transcriptional regulator [Paraglaciecola sp. G1-23]MCF2949397.1 LysR family transcriptional regulator [Paraglaciecola sp. G1-23]
MDSLDAIKTVIAVVETGSFTAASQRLNISKALVSKYIGEIEKQFDVRLFNRTTRKISLTESGSNYYHHALQVLERYEVMMDHVVGEQSSPKGSLRVSAPVTFGEIWLAEHIPEFCQLYPDIQFDLVLNNHAVDMLQAGIDVRIKVGNVEDSTLIARHISDVSRVICASPAYLNTQGTPKNLADLVAHTCIVDTNFNDGKTWELYNSQGQKEVVEVFSDLSCNSPQAIVNMVKAGGGIGYVTMHAAIGAIRSGELVEVLPDYRSQNLGLYVMYPHRKYVSRKVRCFVEFMQQKFKNCNNQG